VARDLRLFYLFRLLATSYLWVPVFVHFMTDRGLGFDQILSLAAIYSGVVILVEIPTGALADRIGRRTSMMFGALAMVASCAIAYFAHSFGVFVIAEVFAAISISLCSGADSAYLFDLLSSNDRGHEYPRREGTASAWKNAGSAIAFAAGGLLGEIDLALPYLATAAVAGIAFVIALALREDELPGRREVEHRPAGAELRAYVQLMRRSIAEVSRSPRLIWIIALSAVVFMLLKSTLYLYQPYLEARDFGIAETGLVFSGVYLVATLVAHNVERLRRRLGEAALVWGLLASLAGSFVLLNQFAGPWALCMLAVQAGANGVYSPLVKPILNRQITDSGQRATILSIESIARRVATGLFIPIIGLYGLDTAIYICGGAACAGMVLLAACAPPMALKRGAGPTGRRPRAAAGQNSHRPPAARVVVEPRDSS
jgi:MFS family permease